MYGKELIIDMHECNTVFFTRQNISIFLVRLCEKIDMRRYEMHFWDDLLEERIATQFTSCGIITIHIPTNLKSAFFINVFSTNEFNSQTVAEICEEFFQGTITQQVLVKRR